MKPLTLYVSNDIYSSYQEMAERTGVKAAALIRSAMEFFMQEKLSKRRDLDSFKPFDSGKLLKDYNDSDFREEMINDRY
mgnify:CR=1 FL=1